MRFSLAWPAILAFLLLLSLPLLGVAQDTPQAPPIPTKVYAMMYPMPGIGTMIMAFATGCEACSHFYIEVDVRTPTGSEMLRRMVPKAPANAATWAYWLVEGEPPAVRIRRATAGNVIGVVEEGFGLDQAASPAGGGE